MTQQYGTVKVDVITYTSGTGGSETDQSITVSSLATISRTGIIITGDINANNIYISGAAQVSGLATVSGLIVGQDATVTGNLVVGSGIQASSLVVQDDATVSGNLGVSGLATVSGLTVTNATSLNTLTATGDTNLSALTATGATNLNTLTATGDSNFDDVAVSGNLTVTGNATISGNLTVSGDFNASGVTISGFTGLFASGSETQPSISFTGDPDTGIYNSDSNAVSITNAGVEHFRLNSDGLLAVGSSGITIAADIGARFRSAVTKNMTVERVSGAGPGDALFEIKGVSQVTGESSQTFLTSGPYLPVTENNRKTRFNIKVRNTEDLNAPGTRFTILGSGYVGINNELPSGVLHIQGPVSAETSGIPTLYLDRLPNVNDTSDIALNANAVIGGQNSLNFVLSEDEAPFRFYVSGDANVSGVAGATQVFHIDEDGPASIVGGVTYQVITAQDIGNQPSQIPLNRDLGTMAYQDNNPYVTSLRFPNGANPLIYEEGTFDELVIPSGYEREDGTLVPVTFNVYSTNYVRIGNQVTCNVRMQIVPDTGTPTVQVGDRIQWAIDSSANLPYIPADMQPGNIFTNNWTLNRRSNNSTGWLAGFGTVGGRNSGVLYYNPITITSTNPSEIYPINGASWIFYNTYLLSPLST